MMQLRPHWAGPFLRKDPQASWRTLVLSQILLPERVIHEDTHWPHSSSGTTQRRYIKVEKHASQALEAATIVKAIKIYAPRGGRRCASLQDFQHQSSTECLCNLKRVQHSTARHLCSSELPIMAQLSLSQHTHQALGQCRNACRPFQAAKRFGRTCKSTITQASSQNEMSRRDAVLAAGPSHRGCRLASHAQCPCRHARPFEGSIVLRCMHRIRVQVLHS